MMLDNIFGIVGASKSKFEIISEKKVRLQDSEEIDENLTDDDDVVSDNESESGK